MDGLSRVAGVGPTVEFQGKTWTVQGRTLDHYALLEAEIIARRGDPFELVVKAAKELAAPSDKKDEDVIDRVARAVSQNFRGWRFVTYHDMWEFRESTYGEMFEIWLALRHNDSSLSVEHIRHWFMERARVGDKAVVEWRDDLLKKIEQATGTDTLGNSTGPRSETAGA